MGEKTHPSEGIIPRIDPWSDYYRSLGKLVSEFGTLEIYLNHTIVSYVAQRISPSVESVKSELITALFDGLSSSRYRSLNQTLKRLLRLGKAPKEVVDGIEIILKQGSDISAFRDILVHQMVSEDVGGKGWFWASNFMFSPETDKTSYTGFHVTHVENAAHDLGSMPHRISEILSPLDESLIGQGNPAIRREKHVAWLYKPSQLVHAGPKHSRKAQ